MELFRKSARRVGFFMVKSGYIGLKKIAFQ